MFITGFAKPRELWRTDIRIYGNDGTISMSFRKLKADQLPTSPTLRSFLVEEAYVFVYLGVAPRLEILSP